MGGPASFTDEHLERVHAHPNIDEQSIDELVMIFLQTLEDHDVDETDIGTIVGELTSRKRLVGQKAGV